MPRNKPYDNFIPDLQFLHQMEVKSQLYALATGLWWNELAIVLVQHSRVLRVA